MVPDPAKIAKIRCGGEFNSIRVHHELFRSTRSIKKAMVATIDSFLESIVGISKGSKGPR